ncbi:MAG: N-acetylneuraminate synthase family protein [Candidatus Hermodarchaeota archaeon]
MKDYKQILKENGFFIIADIGVNYYDIAEKENLSLLEAAKKMIEEATLNGADAVKFQTYKTEKIVSKHAPAYWDLNEEPTDSQYNLFKKYDKFGYEQYKELSDFCAKKNTIFMSTPFDFDAADYLDELMPVFKISSSDLTNTPFIKHVAMKNKPIFLSTGAATLGEIERAINTIKNTGNRDICLFHCILDYPTQFKDINLNMIKHLADIYPEYTIGFSDHTKPDDSMLITTIAYIYGAKIIEKHFTLDKTLLGNDHYHAMEPEDLKNLREKIKFVQQISGQYHKQPMPCELNSRTHARRSIIAKQNITKGDIITREMIDFKRPGTGIPPFMSDYVIGGIALEDLKEDDIITFDKVKLMNRDFMDL